MVTVLWIKRLPSNETAVDTDWLRIIIHWWQPSDQNRTNQFGSFRDKAYWEENGRRDMALLLCFHFLSFKYCIKFYFTLNHVLN
jgi:hypothetical protein